MRQGLFDSAGIVVATNSIAGRGPLSMTRGRRPFRMLVTDEVPFPSTLIAIQVPIACC